MKKKPTRDKFSMRPEYEAIVRCVCGDNWAFTDADERDGGYGVAIVLAYLAGVPPKLGDLSTHLGTPPFALDYAFRRLQANGMFCSRSIALYDTDLISNPDGSEYEKMRSLQAWSWIAGIASGFTGKGLLRSEYAALKIK